jgi:hypothetical protein
MSGAEDAPVPKRLAMRDESETDNEREEGEEGENAQIGAQPAAGAPAEMNDEAAAPLRLRLPPAQDWSQSGNARTFLFSDMGDALERISRTHPSPEDEYDENEGSGHRAMF